MRKKTIMLVLAAAGLLGGCENMSTAQKGAVGGAALGSGIGLVTGGSFGTVVGAGLIGGAVGHLGGTAIQNSNRERGPHPEARDSDGRRSAPHPRLRRAGRGGRPPRGP